MSCMVALTILLLSTFPRYATCERAHLHSHTQMWLTMGKRVWGLKLQTPDSTDSPALYSGREAPILSEAGTTGAQAANASAVPIA